MGGKRSQNKGKRAEREVIRLLQPIVDKVYTDFPQMGETPILQRNLMQSDRGGYDIVGLEWLALEVKFQETYQLNQWWKQTMKQCGHDQIPVLIYRRSHQPWKIMLRLFSPLPDGRRFFCRATIDLDAFLVYFESRLRGELDNKLREIDALGKINRRIDL